MYTLDSSVKSKSKLTLAQLKQAVDSYVPDNNLNGILKTAIEGEEHLGINALFTVAHAAVESGWGRSTFARTRNNFFGFNAVDSNPGLASRYPTPKNSAEFYLEFLNHNYLTEGGKYFKGVKIRNIFENYSTSGDKEAELIAQIMNTLEKKAGVEPNGFPTPKEVKKPAPETATAQDIVKPTEKIDKKVEEKKEDEAQKTEQNDTTEPATNEPDPKKN